MRGGRGRREEQPGLHLAEDDRHVQVRYSGIVPLFAARFNAKRALRVLKRKFVAAHAVVHTAHVVQGDGSHLLAVVFITESYLRLHQLHGALHT